MFRQLYCGLKISLLCKAHFCSDGQWIIVQTVCSRCACSCLRRDGSNSTGVILSYGVLCLGM